MTHGRTRRVRQKRREQPEEEGLSVNINADELLDLIITGAVSSIVTIAVSRAMKNG